MSATGIESVVDTVPSPAALKSTTPETPPPSSLASVVSATSMLLLPQCPHLGFAQTGLLRQQPVISDQVQQTPGDAQAFFALAFLFTLLEAFLALPPSKPSANTS